MQPHEEGEWKRIQDATGMTAEMFLQQALLGHVSVARGQTVLLSYGSHKVPVDIVATKPVWPACRLFAGPCTLQMHLVPF